MKSFLFKGKKELWNTAYYQENLVSPFKFEYLSGKEEGLENLLYNIDSRKVTIMIRTYADIDFAIDNVVYVDNVKYLVKGSRAVILKEYLNSPFFKTREVGTELVLQY